MKKIQQLADEPIFTRDMHLVGLRPAGVPELARKVSELIDIINEQQREIYELKAINERNKETYASYANPDSWHVPVKPLTIELYNNILKSNLINNNQ